MSDKNSEFSEERHLVPGLESTLPTYKSVTGSVGIKISTTCAKKRDGQILLWTLCNLLVRLKHTISAVQLIIPDDIEIVSDEILPLVETQSSLRKGVLESAKVVSRDCVVTALESDDFSGALDVIVLVGQDTSTTFQSTHILRAFSSGWLSFNGSYSWTPKIDVASESTNPFGALFSASIAAGEVFKHLGQLVEGKGSYISDLCWSSYSFKTVNYISEEDLEKENPEFPGEVNLNQQTLVGCGAVGNAFSQALLLIDNIIGDLTLVDLKTRPNGKSETIEETNLNRYLFATPRDIGKFKASFLKSVFERSATKLKIESWDNGFETFVNENPKYNFESVLSCVDNNTARHAIQEQIPRTILGASTNGMQIQLSLYDLALDGQCLKCYNDLILDDETDEQIISRLRAMSPVERANSAEKVGIEPNHIEQFLGDPACGVLGYDSIQKFANKTESDSEWAVSFVSSFSGFAMASELIKRYSYRGKGLDGSNCTDLFFNFFYDYPYLSLTKPNKQCWCNQGNPSPRAIFSKFWKLE